MADNPLPKPQKPGSPPASGGNQPPKPTPPPSAMVSKPSVQPQSSAPGGVGSTSGSALPKPPVPGGPPKPTPPPSAPQLGSAAPGKPLPNQGNIPQAPKPPATPAPAGPLGGGSAGSLPPAGPKPNQGGPQVGPQPTPAANPAQGGKPAAGAPTQQANPQQANQTQNKGPVKPNISAPGSQDKKPMFAKITKSPFKFVPIIVGILVVVGGIAFAATRFLGGGSEPVTVNTPSGNNTGNANQPTQTEQQTTLTYWGLWEPSTVLEEVIADYEAQNPGIKIDYIKQNHVDYRERLQTAIAAQKGPDLFRYHASWVPMLAEELAPLPNSIMSVNEYQQTFFPVAIEQLQVDGQLVGIPLMYDGLGLYINDEIFTEAGVKTPTSWAEVKTIAQQLTVRSSNGGIERGGIALGNASNVEHFADIIGLLMLQNGADPADPSSKEALEAVQFYTNFVTSDRVWSDQLPNATVAFAREEVAMMIAPSWRAHEVVAINPSIGEFSIRPVPTLGDQKVTWATYWAEGVNDKSANKEAAWSFIKYMSSESVMKKMYSAQSDVRAFGEPYSRQDLAEELVSSATGIEADSVASYLEEAPYAKNWYLNTYTHDNGLNDNLIKYYRDAVNAIVAGTRVDEAMEVVEQGTAQVLRQYAN